jgi:hypothetical protein
VTIIEPSEHLLQRVGHGAHIGQVLQDLQHINQGGHLVFGWC